MGRSRKVVLFVFFGSWKVESELWKSVLKTEGSGELKGGVGQSWNVVVLSGELGIG